MTPGQMAADLMAHYLRIGVEAAGKRWEADHDAECELFVACLTEAVNAAREVTQTPQVQAVCAAFDAAPRGCVMTGHRAVEPHAERLAALADSIDRRLNNENADRQTIAEDVAAHLRMLAHVPPRADRTSVTLDPVQLDRVLGALADAATYRRRQAGGSCADCDANPDEGVCADHLDDLDLADAYDTVARDLRQEADR
jgi:hypothetical protein